MLYPLSYFGKWLKDRNRTGVLKINEVILIYGTLPLNQIFGYFISLLKKSNNQLAFGLFILSEVTQAYGIFFFKGNRQ